MQQHTLKICAEFAGVGLHSGEHCKVVVHPAGEDQGIVFRRMGNDGVRHKAEILADPHNVIESDHGTTLANEYGASVATVEHLLAAFALLAIDNVKVDVYGPEIPILDGSALGFVEGLQKAGLAKQRRKRNEIIVTRPSQGWRTVIGRLRLFLQLMISMLISKLPSPIA